MASRAILPDSTLFNHLQGRHPWLSTYNHSFQLFFEEWENSEAVVTADSLKLYHAYYDCDFEGTLQGIGYELVNSYPLQLIASDTLSLDGVPYVMRYDEEVKKFTVINKKVGGYQFSVSHVYPKSNNGNR